MQFLSYNIILMYQVAIFSIKKSLLRQSSEFVKIWGSEVKGQAHHMTKYGENAVLEPQLHSHIHVPGSNFCKSKKLIEGLSSIYEIQSPKVRGHHIK